MHHNFNIMREPEWVFSYPTAHRHIVLGCFSPFVSSFPPIQRCFSRGGASGSPHEPPSVPLHGSLQPPTHRDRMGFYILKGHLLNFQLSGTHCNVLWLSSMDQYLMHCPKNLCCVGDSSDGAPDNVKTKLKTLEEPGPFDI